MDPHLAELSRTIDAVELGRRIRNARLAAGMTQAQVVAGEVTPAYLSRIEDGQRRPELGLLERMARRMDTSLEYLLAGDDADNRDAELELAVDHAELALVSGSADEALAAVDRVLTELDEKPNPQLRRRALRVLAGGLESRGKLNEAIVLLEDLVAEPTADVAWLKSLIALSRCYRDSGEFAKAIAVGERASEPIEAMGLSGLTEAIQLTVTVAAAYQRLGDLGEAMRTCMRALKAAEAVDSPIAKASAYWNASSIRAASEGATDETIELAKKALTLFEVGEDNRNLAKLRVEVANLHLSTDPPNAMAALQITENADVLLAWSGASAWEQSLLHLIRGRAHALRGDYPLVEEALRRAREIMPEEARILAASASALEGQVAFARGDVESARDCYRQAALSLHGAGADRDAAELWFELANLLTEAGDAEAALEAFRSAGASSGFRLTTRSFVPTL